jgi:hypothetical protein
MTKDNLIIYVSSRNNYDMLAGEVFRNTYMEGFEFINHDSAKGSLRNYDLGKY